jgi:short-subunit dehydrogenase
MRRILFAAALASLVLAGLRLRRPRYTVAGKTVIVTGGGRGLGLALAREVAARGGRVGLCARSEIELGAARSELEARGATVATSVCDVRDERSVEYAFALLGARLGPPDILINVAGIIGVGPIEALDFSDFSDAMETNFFGALRATLAVLPAMRARRAGRIVNITSLGGEVAIPHMLPYCASKFAFAGFSQGLAAEVARDGVLITTVIPGLMRTGSPPNATFAGQPKKEYAIFALSDATPFTSVSVEHAARVIVDGAERGAQRVIVSWQAKFALLARGVSPELVVRVMTLAGFALPRAGAKPEHRVGSESESPLTRSPLNALSKRASHDQNELLDPEQGRSPAPE